MCVCVSVCGLYKPQKDEKVGGAAQHNHRPYSFRNQLLFWLEEPKKFDKEKKSKEIFADLAKINNNNNNNNNKKGRQTLSLCGPL